MGLKSSICGVTGTFFPTGFKLMSLCLALRGQCTAGRPDSPFSQNAACLFMSSSALIHAAVRLSLHHFLFESQQRLMFETDAVSSKRKEKKTPGRIVCSLSVPSLSSFSSTTNIVIEVVLSNVAEVEMKSQARSWRIINESDVVSAKGTGVPGCERDSVSLRTSHRAPHCESRILLKRLPGTKQHHFSSQSLCSVQYFMGAPALNNKGTATAGRHWKLSCLLSGLQEQHQIQTKQAARLGTLIQNHKMTGFSWNNKAGSLEPDCLCGANHRSVVSLKSLSVFSQWEGLFRLETHEKDVRQTKPPGVRSNQFICWH